MTYRPLTDQGPRIKIDAATEKHTGATRYEIGGFDASANPAWDGSNQHAVTITLQHGPVTEGKPPNGVTVEALLAIVIDAVTADSQSRRVMEVVSHCREAMKLLGP